MTTVIAVGSSGKIARSIDDGVSWSAVTSPTSNSLTDVKNNGASEWVATGLSSTVLHSTDDGVTWTAYTVGGPNWVSVAYGSTGTWVIVESAFARIATSTDGINWTLQTNGYSPARDIDSVHWDNVNSVFIGTGEKTYVQDSPDGITWTARSEILPSAPFVRIGCGAVWHTTASLYVASTDGTSSGFPGPLKVYTTGSPPGSPWSERYSVAGRYGIKNAIETNGTTTLVGDGHGQVHSSTDAATWSAVAGWPVSVSTSVACRGICWTGTAWVTVHSFGIIVRTEDLVSFSDFFWPHSTTGILGVGASTGGPAPQTYAYETGAVNYTLTLTGSGDSLSDLTLPMASARATFSNQRLSTFQAVVPTTTYYDDIVARTNGELVVDAERVLSDGTTSPSVELWRFPYTDVTKTVGAGTGSIELVAEEDVAYTTGNTVELKNTERHPERGRVVMRSDVDFYARPADTATLVGSDIEEFTIGKVEYTIDPSNSYMVVSEFIDDDGAE